jgi:REP element-mobilizing transposase RayT
MVNYRRNFVPGGTYFFTVTLADRSSKILTDRIDLLRNALRALAENAHLSSMRLWFSPIICTQF